MIRSGVLSPQKLSHEHMQVLEPFFHNNIAPLAILDKDFNFIGVNKAYAAADEREPVEFIGRNHFDLYPSEDNERIFREVVTTKKSYRVRAKPFVYAGNPERGTTHWDWSLSPVLGVDGEVTMLICSLYEVTERVRATEDLERFVRLSLDALCTIDAQGRPLMANAALCSMLGYSREELQSWSIQELIHPDDRDKTIGAMRTHIHERQPVTQFENRYRCKDGTYRWLQWSLVLGRDLDRFYAVARDITAHKELEREMLRLNGMNILAKMAATISHEVRNPMTTVRGFLQLLKGKEDCAQYADYYDLMIEELDRANAIITEYLSVGRRNLASDKVQSLNKIIETLIPLLQADAVSEGKMVVCRLGAIPDLLLNGKEIRQLILNLVRNGLEAMPKVGQVTVSTAADEQHVVLSVQDQGPGIPDSVLERLGTPFFTTKEGGTGLGLATCYSIADRHNASIVVETSSTGTTFQVRFAVGPSDNRLE